MMNKVLEYYVSTYPQLTLGIKEGMKNTEEYKDIVLRGNVPDHLSLPFKTEGKEERIFVETPIGTKEVLYLPERNVFEYFVRVLAYRCEPVDIPRTTGAIMIKGLNNWRKIEKHEEEFLKDHKEEEWSDEFDRFTSNPENYRDSVLLISRGPYSNVSCTEVGYNEEEWLNLSKEIRIYHELSHLIARTKYPEHQEAIRDEIIADCIGILHAVGHFDELLLKRVLGIKENMYIPGSRLENYIEKEKLPQAIQYTITFIEKLKEFMKERNAEEPFETLLEIEKGYIK